MRCFWLLALLALMSSAPTSARAEDCPRETLGQYQGVTGIIRFRPPEGFATLSANDPEYQAIEKSLSTPNEGAPGKSGGEAPTLVTAFQDCATGTTLGYVSIETVGAGYDDLGEPFADAYRARFVKVTSDLLREEAEQGSPWQVDGINDSAVFTAYRQELPGVAAAVQEAAITMIASTAVTVALGRSYLQPDHPPLVAVSRDLRATLETTLDEIGSDNGFALHPDRDPAAAYASDELGLDILLFGFGGILLITLRWLHAPERQILATVATVVLGAAVYLLAPGAIAIWTGNLFLDFVIWCLAAATLNTLFNFAFAGLQRLSPRALELLRFTISPSAWSERRPLESRPFAKKWFVTIAAATGVAIVALMDRDALTLVTEAFSFEHILFTLLAAVVSITLVGPVEDMIFEPSRRALPVEAETRFEAMIRMMSVRAFGRLLLVLLLILLLTGMHGVLDERINSGDTGIIRLIVLSTTTPAVVTYLWCTALQHRVKSVARRAGSASMLVGTALLGLPWTLGYAIYVFVTRPPTLDTALLESSIGLGLVLVGAPLAGALLFGVYGFCGGLVIDLASRRRLSPTVTVVMMTLVLFVLNGLLVLLWSYISGRFMELDLTEVLDWTTLLLPIGWGIGLWVSGFPAVLDASRQPDGEPTDPPASPEPSAAVG